MKVLELKDVKKTFQKNKKTFTAVDGVSFSIEKGECIGLVGNPVVVKVPLREWLHILSRPPPEKFL